MINWRLFTIGGLVSFIGSLLWKAQTSQWIQMNIPSFSGFLAPYGMVIQLIIIIGAVVVAFALFWGRWIPAVVFGILFALAVYVLTIL